MRFRFWLLSLLVGLSMTAVAQHGHHGHIKDPLPANFDQDVVILDVRTTGEYKDEHVLNALNIYYRDVDESIGKVTTDKTRQFLVYCAVGMRARRAQDTLQSLGYTNVINMGGLVDMIDAGFETEN